MGRALKIGHPRGIRTVTAAAVLVWTALPVAGQTITTGEVTGLATDLSGAVVANAKVHLKSLETGESRAAQSNAAGAYRFIFVRPAEYQISATAGGLRSDATRLLVAVGQVQVLNLTLKLEEPKEVVLVTGEAPLLNTDNANVTYTVSGRQLELLPLPGGDLVGVAYTAPGVITNNRYGFGNFSSMGLPGISNLFTVNGIDDMDPYFNGNNSGTTGLLLGANEIREASVVQNAYEGQYGRQAGAQVNYVSKSGANAYHGNLLYNYNGTKLNANDFFGNAAGAPRPHGVSNQYGASVGGRIKKDKLFFFADVEGLRYALPGAATVVAIPSQALENFTLKAIQPAQAPLYRRAFSLYNSTPGRDRAVAVTTGNGPLQDSFGTLGCGTLAGTPTGSGGIFGKDASCTDAFGAFVPMHTSEWLLSSRVDYNLNGRQRMFFRFKTDQGILPVVTSAVNPVFNIISNQPDYEGQFNHTFVITPRVVNNLIGSASYSSYTFEPADPGGALAAFPLRFNINDGGANGSSGRMSPLGAAASYPSGRRTGQLQIVDDLSLVAGNHSLKTGVNYRYNREADLQYSALSYVGRFAFSGLDEFASGALNPHSGSNYTHSFPASPVLHLRLYTLGFYLQDQWAVTPHWKITATVRFDRTGNPYCRDHCFARFTQPFPQLDKGIGIPYNQSIQSGLASAFYRSEPVVLQPRLSMVFNPGRSKGTVLRGGIGLFSDLYPAFFAGIAAGNPPNVFTSVIRTGLVNTGGVGSAPAIALDSANAFQSQFAAGATLEQLGRAVAPAKFTPPFYFSIPSTVRTPKVLKWSFEMERRLGPANVLTLRYSGNHGYDIFLRDPNANASRDPAQFPGGFAGLPAAAPDPRFGAVYQLTNSGYSNYNALTVAFRHRFGSGLQGQISYTWSHALDTLSNGGLLNFSYDSVTGQVNPRDVRSLNYSNADYDVRHNITWDLIWDIPARFQNRAIRLLLGNWSLAGKLNLHTGTPFSVENNRVAGRLSPSFGGPVLADVLDPAVHSSCGNSAVDTPCFTARQFATVTTQVDLGNMPRNSFRGPGYFNVDSAIYKTISIRDQTRFTIGITTYNLLNHPNFADPASDVGRPSLGLIQSTVTPPSGPYGLYGGPSGRALVATGRFTF